MVYTKPTVLLNSVDYTDYVIPETINMLASIQNGVSSQLELVVKGVPGSYSVEGGSRLDFYLPNQENPTFSGLHTRSYPGRYAAGRWMYKVRAVGWEQIFHRRQLFTALRGVSFVGAINQILTDPDQSYPSILIQSVVNTNNALEGDMPFYAINGAFPSEIFDLISNLTGTTWRVNVAGGNLELEFFDPFQTYNGFTLTQTNESFHWRRFEPVTNLDSIINTQSVRGSQALSQADEIAYFRGDDLTSKFPLPTKPFNNAASVVLFDSFGSDTISTSYWFESDTGDQVYADGDGFIQYEPTGGNTTWVGIISSPLAYRVNQPMMVVDITWVSNGIAMFGLTTQNAVPSEPEQFLEAGVYIDASGKVYGVAGGTIVGDSGLTLSGSTQYRFRFIIKRNGGCTLQYQAGADIYSRNWTTMFDVSTGDSTALGSAVMTYRGNFSLASVKTTYPYLGIKVEVDRGSGYQEETLGIGDVDEDVDSVIIEESVIAFFGSNPGPSTIPPAPDWQEDVDYKNIRVTYRRGVNIFATYQDNSSVSDVSTLFGGGDDGVREGAIIVDENITTYQAALARGRTEVLNNGNIVEQILAETSTNILTSANVPFPNVGELSRYDITIPTTNYAIQRDIPIRKVSLRAKSGANDMDLIIDAGYLKRGLRSVLKELVSAGKILSINENQVIYRGASLSESLGFTEDASSLGSSDTARWGDSRADETFTVDTGTEIVTTDDTHVFITGDDVVVTSSGTLPSPLAVGTVYYVNKQSSTTLYLYDTLANAISGGATGRVDLTDTGSGTHTISLNGWQWGHHKWGSFAPYVTLSARGILQAQGRIL